MARKKYPVVVLHGWMLTSARYVRLKQAIENKGYKVYIPDMPGNGQETEPERPWVLDDYVQFVKKFCLDKNIKECQIIAHSFGGRVGIKLAAANPNLVKELVLTGVPGFTVESKLRRSLLQIIAKIGRIIFLLPFWPSKYTLNRTCSGSGLGHYMKKLLYKLVGTHDYNNTTGVMRQTFKDIIRDELTEPMGEIRCPTKLVWGENDQTVPVKIAKKMQKEIADCELITIPNVGHDLPINHSEDFSKILNYPQHGGLRP